MLIKICAVNSKFIHSNLAVYSLGDYYYHLCKEANIKYSEIKIHEYTINDVYKNVLFHVLSDSPDIIAFSVYIWNIDFVSRLCGDIKKIAPQTKIILGGPEVSFGVSIDNDMYDYIIIGEGERAFFCIINEIQGNDILYYKDKFDFKIDENKITCKEIENLLEIPFVYSHENINLFQDRIIYYESSRGCPFSCSYCLSACIKGVRYLPLERVYSDIDFFIDKRNEAYIKQVKFVDRTFNSDKNRAYSIFEYIINKVGHDDRNINFHFEICADLLDDNIINLLSKAKSGLIQFEIGIQTTNKKTLDLCARKTDIKKCFDNINLLLENKNINIHVDLIAGLPDDTLDSFEGAFNQVYFLHAHQFQLGFLKLLKGAPLNSQLQQYGYKFSDRPPYEILSNADMTYDDLSMLSGIEIVLDKFYNSGKFESSLNYLTCHNCFKTPFDFYLRIAKFLAQRDILYRSFSLENLYNILLDFSTFSNEEKNIENIKNIDEIDIVHLKKMLLWDYHRGDMYDKPPKAVRDIWMPYKSYKDEVNEIDARHENINLTARKIGQKYYYFDYSRKNPVTGKYNQSVETTTKNED